MERFYRLPEKVRFLAAGAFNTLTGYALFAGLYALAGDRLHYLGVLIAAHLIAVLIAVLTLKRLVFRSKGRLWPEYIRGHISYAGTLAANAGLLYALVDLAGWRVLPAQAAAIAAVTILSFLLHKHFTFRTHRS